MLNYLPERIYAEFENDDEFNELTDACKAELFGIINSNDDKKDILLANYKYCNFNSENDKKLIQYLISNVSEEYKDELNLFMNNEETSSKWEDYKDKYETFDDETKAIYLYVKNTTLLPTDKNIEDIDVMTSLIKNIKDRENTSQFLGYVYYFFSCWNEYLKYNGEDKFDHICEFEKEKYEEAKEMYSSERYTNMIEYSRLRFYKIFYDQFAQFEIDYIKVFEYIKNIFDNTIFKYKDLNNCNLEFLSKALEVISLKEDEERTKLILDELLNIVLKAFDDKYNTMKKLIYCNYSYMNYFLNLVRSLLYIVRNYMRTSYIQTFNTNKFLNLSELEQHYFDNCMTLEEKEMYLDSLNIQNYTEPMVNTKVLENIDKNILK